MRKIFLLISLFFVRPGFSQVCETKLFSLTDQNIEHGNFLRRYDIKFDYNRSTLLASDTIFLDSLADFLNDRKEFIIEIGVHYNMLASNPILSSKRAKSIKAYLVGKNVDPARLKTKSYGYQEPIVPPNKINKAKTVRERDSLLNLNRRIEFRIVRIDPLKQKLFTMQDSVFYPGSVFRTYALSYNPDTAALSTEGMLLLDSIADFLKLHPGINLQVGVYSTIRGVEYDEAIWANKKLTAICNYLLSEGVSPDRLDKKYYGYWPPLFPKKQTADEAVKQKLLPKNDRVEFKIIKMSSEF